MLDRDHQDGSNLNPHSPLPNVLTIGGSDPSGGAGIQADLKTFAALRTYGCAVITALTAQNTRDVAGIHIPDSGFVALQLETLFKDVQIKAIKIGMVANPEVASAVAEQVGWWRETASNNTVVLDPVMVSKSGNRLVDNATVRAIRQCLLPLADVLTPNCHEAAVLLDQHLFTQTSDIVAAAQHLRKLGPQSVLIKGGGMQSVTCDDVLAEEDQVSILSAQRLPLGNQHGAGCTLSSAIAAYCAHGTPLRESITWSKEFVTQAMRHADRLNVGSGQHPLHHSFAQMSFPGTTPLVVKKTFGENRGY
jgi:hydroxymethylpyrimidine/phosphomethylpyrimidine kinase